MTIYQGILALLYDIKPSVNWEIVPEIIENCYLDSLELLALITGMTDQFGIEIGVEEISEDNFRSVNAMTQMIDRLKNDRI